MDYIRPAAERGTANFGWLQSRHSFSFGSYVDPKHSGFSSLRVINEDRVAPSQGFGRHGHQDMEIISYVVSGALEHKDSLGNRHLITPGEVQCMSAGTGIVHSEYNASSRNPVHFLQIWITPSARGGSPGYQQKRIVQHGAATPLITPDGRDGTLSLGQDASLYRIKLAAGEQQRLFTGERLGYLQLVEGEARANGQDLIAGDGLGLLEHRELLLQASDRGVEALWFDLPNLPPRNAA